MRALFLLACALAIGEAHAFDPQEQATIDAMQQQIVLLQAQLAHLTGSAISPEDAALLSWSVAGVLAIGFGIKQIRDQVK